MRKILAFSLVITMALVLSGCSLTGNPTNNKTETKAPVTIVDKNTNESATFEGDIPLYTGSETSSASTNPTDGSYYTTFNSADPFATVDGYYWTELKTQGWTVLNFSKNDTASPKSDTIIATKDTRRLTVSINENMAEDKVTDVSVSLGVAVEKTTAATNTVQ